jgi:vitamin B12 transporter
MYFKNFRLFFLLPPLLWSAFAPAQPDSSAATLPEVQIGALRYREPTPGEKTEAWDSAALKNYAHTNLAELLSRESGVFIKTYGQGSLATSALRGGNAGHTAVLWNGLPLSSPMLGLLDLALLPGSLADRVELHYGGNTALWGSGAVGGHVALQNRPDYERAFALEYGEQAGSFGLRSRDAQIQFARSRWAVKTRFFQQNARNDFPYRLRPELPEKRQEHAKIRQQGFLQELYWRPGPRQQLALHLWRQTAQREIPPLTTQTRSSAGQHDGFLRTALHWQFTEKKWVWQARGACFFENIDYGDTLSGVFAQNNFYTLHVETEARRRLARGHSIQIGANHHYARAEADGYRGPAEQNQTALFGAWNGVWKNLRVQASGRLARVDHRLVPFVPSLNMEYQWRPQLRFSARISRNYRLPTLNERFWTPGGKPDIRPESGWGGEAGLKTRFKNVQYQFTAYKRHMRDWVLWSILPGENFWSANNITAVDSRGIEQNIRYVLDFRKNTIKISVGHDLARSTVQKQVERPRLTAGEQLIYVPVHQVYGMAEWAACGFVLTYRHRCTGSVRTLSDPLPAYDLGFLSLQYGVRRPNWQAAVFFRLDNAWNTQYRAVERRPMPGRSFVLGLRGNIGT